MAKLNEVEKGVIALFLEDCSYQEIAEVMGMNANQVGVLLHLNEEEAFCSDAGSHMSEQTLKELWQSQPVMEPSPTGEDMIQQMKRRCADRIASYFGATYANGPPVWWR